MALSIVVQEVPPAGPVPSRFEAAAGLLEQAIRAGCKDAAAPYLLGLAYKRQGNLKEARTAFRKVAPADANVFLQLGLLSLEEGQLVQADQEFARAWELGPDLYEAGYDLLLTRLS